MLDVLVQVKRMGNLLNEVHDISRQLAEAVDRDDKVSVELLVNMRREPIEKLLDTERVLHEQSSAAAQEEGGGRLAALLNGEPAQGQSEQALEQAVAGNRRILDRVRELDRVINQKLAREKSIYQ